MNLHVTNDNNGFFPKEIARRIKESEWRETNLMVNLSMPSVLRDETITYIPLTSRAIRKYITSIKSLDKIIFHPYNINSYPFLKIVLEKFPDVKVYWVCWSYELYNTPEMEHKLYEEFSAHYLKRKLPLKIKSKNAVRNLVLHFSHAIRIRKKYDGELKASYALIDYFCSMMPDDYSFFKKLSPGIKAAYIPFAYLSLDTLMPGLDDFRSTGNQIMIGHSSSPQGNHYEIIQRLNAINPGADIFLPLAYGDRYYANLIKNEAAKKFKNLEVQEQKLENVAYSQKLTGVGWAVINSKVQQGLGNILALIWLGAKIFVDENTSTYKDFSAWGIIIFTVQRDLNEYELSNKLDELQIENNRRIILKRFNEQAVSGYWKNILA